MFVHGHPQSSAFTVDMSQEGRRMRDQPLFDFDASFDGNHTSAPT